MITKTDIELANALKKKLIPSANFPNRAIEESYKYVELIDKLIANLLIAPKSYRYCSKEDKSLNYYTAECRECGWWGSSKLLLGGGQIADTGDYNDVYCPVCNNNTIDEKEEIMEKTQ